MSALEWNHQRARGNPSLMKGKVVSAVATVYQITFPGETEIREWNHRGPPTLMKGRGRASTHYRRVAGIPPGCRRALLPSPGGTELPLRKG